MSILSGCYHPSKVYFPLKSNKQSSLSETLTWFLDVPLTETALSLLNDSDVPISTTGGRTQICLDTCNGVLFPFVCLNGNFLVT